MDALEFQKDFLEEVKSTAVVAGEGSTAAFVSIMTEYLINSEVIPDFTPSFFLWEQDDIIKILESMDIVLMKLTIL